jgi:hypothetical protein
VDQISTEFNSERTREIRMNLTKCDLGRMLIAKLEAKTDTVALSRWAYQVYLDNSRNLDPWLKEVLLDLARMEDAPEFEYATEELYDLARAMAQDANC